MAFEKPIFAFFGEGVIFNEKMSRHTTLKVGGEAKYFITVKSLLGINRATEFAHQNNLTLKVVGNGSNLLVSDNGFNGVILSIKGLNDITHYQKGDIIYLTVGGGAMLFEVFRYCVQNGISEIEGLAGIPATIGGAVKMNAGAFGYTVGETVEEVTVLKNGKIQTLNNKQCGFSYRKSRIGKDDIIVSVKLRLKKDKSEEILDRFTYFKELRKNTQPKGFTCGSVFKNPNGLYVGLLIETAGLKGKMIGGAKVSEKHANFIENVKSATATDVKRLIDIIKYEVNKKFNVLLEEEVELLGEF